MRGNVNSGCAFLAHTGGTEVPKKMDVGRDCRALAHRTATGGTQLSVTAADEGATAPRQEIFAGT